MIRTLAFFKRCCESVLIAKGLPRQLKGQNLESLTQFEVTQGKGAFEEAQESASYSRPSGFLLTAALLPFLLLQDPVHRYL